MARHEIKLFSGRVDTSYEEYQLALGHGITAVLQLDPATTVKKKKKKKVSMGIVTSFRCSKKQDSTHVVKI